ncbi:hypothetical protein Emed_001404 [Eimeria media]
MVLTAIAAVAVAAAAFAAAAFVVAAAVAAAVVAAAAAAAAAGVVAAGVVADGDSITAAAKLHHRLQPDSFSPRHTGPPSDRSPRPASPAPVGCLGTSQTPRRIKAAYLRSKSIDVHFQRSPGHSFSPQANANLRRGLAQQQGPAAAATAAAPAAAAAAAAGGCMRVEMSLSCGGTKPEACRRGPLELWPTAASFSGGGLHSVDPRPRLEEGPPSWEGPPASPLLTSREVVGSKKDASLDGAAPAAASAAAGAGALASSAEVSFVTVESVPLHYAKGAQAPSFCHHAGCRAGATHAFFGKGKSSCFSISSCSSCPPHPSGMPRICSLHGKRKGYQMLMQNVLISGAPPSSFRFRKASPEEIKKSIPSHAPLAAPPGAAPGAGRAAAAAAAAGGGAAAAEAEGEGEEEGGYEDETEEEWMDSQSQQTTAFLDLTSSPCSTNSSNSNNSSTNNDTSNSSTNNNNNSSGSSSSSGSSFLQSMPGFDTYEADEDEESSAGVGQSQPGGSRPWESGGGKGGSSSGGPGGRGPKGPLTQYKEKRIFSLAPSGVAGRVDGCHIDHKGYMRVQVSVVFSQMDPRKPAPFVFNTFGPQAGGAAVGGAGAPAASPEYSEEEGGEWGETDEEGGEAFVEFSPNLDDQLAAASSNPTAAIAAAAAVRPDSPATTATTTAAAAAAEGGVYGLFEQGSHRRQRMKRAEREEKEAASLASSFLQTETGGIGRFFKRRGGDDEGDDEGGDDDDEGGGSKKPGFFKRLFKRKSKQEGEEEGGEGDEEGDYGEDEEGEPSKGKKGGRKGSSTKGRRRVMLKGMGKKIKKFGKTSGDVLLGSNILKTSVDASIDFSSPAAPKCGTPAVWQGRLRVSSLVRVTFNVRVLWAEVSNQFEAFISSALALELTCKERNGCLLDNALISCVQVSCPKKREMKAGLREELERHRKAAEQQLQQVAEALQKGSDPQSLNMAQRAKIAQAYAERMKQLQEQRQLHEKQHEQLLLQQIQQHQQIELQKQQQLALQQQLAQPQRPGAPLTVSAEEGGEQEAEEEEQQAETQGQTPPPKPRAKVSLVLSGGAPGLAAGWGPWALAGAALWLLLLC